MADDTSDVSPVLVMPAALPRDGARVWYFPGARDHGHADVIARVHRRDGTSWVACLPETDTGAFVMPCGDRVYLAGGVAHRDDPKSWRALCLKGYIRVSWSPLADVVVFCDGASIEVFGTEGPLWHAFELAEMRVERVEPSAITCEVYDPTLGECVQRRFDVATGRAL